MSKSKKSIQQESKVLGLKNHGNTCYLSSIVQCLRSLDQFMVLLRELERSAEGRKLLYQRNVDNEDELLPSDNLLSSLVMFLVKKERSFDFMIVNSVRNYPDTPFPAMVQSDAHEFFVWTLNNIQESVRTTGSDQLIDLTRMFNFGLNQMVVCEHGHESVLQEDEMFLSIGIDPKENLSLQRQLDNHFEVESMDDERNLLKCDECNKSVKSDIHKWLNSMPNVLVVHLKLFEFDVRNNRLFKIRSQVDANQQIDLSAHLDQEVCCI